MELIVVLVAVVVAASSARAAFRSGDSESMIFRLFALVILALSLGVIWLVANNRGHAMEALKSWVEPMLPSK